MTQSTRCKTTFLAGLFVAASFAGCTAAQAVADCDRWKIREVRVETSYHLRLGTSVNSVTINYRNGENWSARLNREYGNIDRRHHTFALEEGEVIVKFLYRVGYTNCMLGFQMVTNYGRYSPWYGSEFRLSKFTTQELSTSEYDPIVKWPFDSRNYGWCSLYQGIPSADEQLGYKLSQVSEAGHCLKRIANLDATYARGRQFKICSVYRFKGHCLHTGRADAPHGLTDVENFRDPGPTDEVENWPGSLWEFHLEQPGGPWLIRSVLYPTHYLHIGGWYEDVRVWDHTDFPGGHGGSRWYIFPDGTGEAGSTRWVFTPAEPGHHDDGYLHVGFWWWYTLVWGKDEGSYWYIEQVD